MQLNQAAGTFVFLSFFYLTTTETKFDDDPIEEGIMNFTQIADQLGLKCEVHSVVTEDGYVLTLFHLPGDKSRPVFLLSGNWGSADDYIARGNTSLPAVLAGAGYDVWVGNWRGCKYGRRHLALDPDRDRAFWDFSFHEYAKYDAAAHIDHVLNQTGAARVACVGWSLGTTTFYVLGALKPEYVDKVAVVISLAPIGFLHHSVTFLNFVPIYPLIEAFIKYMDIREFPKEKSLYTTLMRFVCRSEEWGYKICVKGGLFPAYGYDPNNLEPQFTPILFSHFPSPVSTKAIRHLAQLLMRRRISNFDYGPIENLRRYGSLIAPDYELSKNNMSVVMISGKNDLASTLPDVELLKARLPNVVDHVLLEPAEFTHFDFPYGKNSNKVLYKPHILNYLKKYLLT